MRGEASSASHTAPRLATKASRKELHVLTAAQRSSGERSFFSTSAHSSWDSALASVAAGCEEDTTVAATAAVLLAVGGAMLAGDAMLAVDGAASDAAIARAELAWFSVGRNPADHVKEWYYRLLNAQFRLAHCPLECHLPGAHALRGARLRHRRRSSA